MNTYVVVVLLLTALYTVVDLAFALAVMRIPSVRLRYAAGVLASGTNKVAAAPFVPQRFDQERFDDAVAECDCELCKNMQK